MVFHGPWYWPMVFAYCNAIKGSLSERRSHHIIVSLCEIIDSERLDLREGFCQVESDQ